MAFLVLAAAPAQADQTRHNEWWLRALGVTTAWDITRGSGVTVAVLDTGVDQTQPDLNGSVTTGPDYTNSGRTAGGPLWGIHGTEMASLIAGHGHGIKHANGIIGIAPTAKILSVRVTLESNDPQLANPTIAGALPSAIARGIKWAVRHGATVIDLPLDPVTSAGAPGFGGSAAERAAVAYALSKHVVLVAPAGDEGAGTSAVNYPAAYHGVIAVGAFDQRFVKAPFSSRRPYVTVTAAGAGVTAANPSSLSATDPAKAYTQLNSTSAASAMVAGIVALIRAQFPDLSPAQVTRAITTGTVYGHGGRRAGSGSGSVNAAKALTAAAGIEEAVPKTAASGAAQSPPSPSPSPTSQIPRNITGKLVMDAAIAGVVFLLLLGLTFAIRAWRRRHARSVRLAEVRAATQVPARKPVTAKKGKAKKGKAKKGPAKKGTAKKGAPTAPRAPAVIGDQAPDAEAAPEFQPAGFIPAPLSPAIPGSASPTFGRSASTGFTGSSGFGGSSSPGFTGSSGFTGSAMPGSGGSASSSFTGSGMPGSGGSASSGFAGSASSGFAGSASSGFAGSASSGFAAPTPPAGAGASAGFGFTAEPSPLGAQSADAAPPAELAAPVDPASLASQEPTDTTKANEPPWASIPSEPHGLAREAGAAIPDSAFPAAADAAGAGTASGPGGAGLMGIRRPPTAAHRPAPTRIAQVSGRPPWEPAPRPDSELPWAQAPAPPRGGTGSLPKPEQTRPALPSWDTLAEDVWPGGPRGAALHPPVSLPPGRDHGGLAGRGSTAGAPAMGTRPPGRPMPAAGGLVPPQPDAPTRARPAEERPGHHRNPEAGATPPFRATQSEPAPAADRRGAGSGFSPGSKPVKATGSPSTGSVDGPPDSAAASPPTDFVASPPDSTAPRPPTDSTASPPDSATASPPTDFVASPPESATASPPADPTASSATGAPASSATDAAASPPDSATTNPPTDASTNPPTDASTSEAAAPLPRRLSAPPLRPPSPFPPSQPGTGSSLFRSPTQSPIPPPPRPAGKPGAAGTWQPKAEARPFPPASKPESGAPARFATAPDPPATDAPAEPGPPDTGKARPRGPRPMGGSAPAVSPGGSGPTFPRAARPSTGSRPTSGVPPWEITDSFLAVPPTSAETVQAGPEPKMAGPRGGLPGPDTTGAGDSTESFPAVDPAAEQRSFPRGDRGGGKESFPTARPRPDDDAFRLFPPVRRTGNQPPAPPPTDDQD